MKKMILLAFSLMLSVPAFADTYSIAYINLGYGKLDVSSGDGNLNIKTDKKNQIQSLSVDVEAGMFGINETIQKSISVQDLLALKTLEFYMSGGNEPVLKITPLKGFNKNGGKVKFSVRKRDGFYSQEIEILRGASSRTFHLWKGDSIIEEIAINMRGYSTADMYVGWYELE